VRDIARRLADSGTHVLVNFLPVGSQAASELYAQAALEAGCAFLNCIPSVIARDPAWAARFAGAGLPLAGDDLKSRFGATLIHHAVVDALQRSGVRLRSTYQLPAGGNMDFLTMEDPERMADKKATKAQGMGVAAPAGAGAASGPGPAHAGAGGTAAGGGQPQVQVGADFVPFLGDRKVTVIRVEAEAFGGTPVDIDLRTEVDDSPSAAGNVLDAVRFHKAALDCGIGGVVDPVSAAVMKATPTRWTSRASPQSLTRCQWGDR
jgi:myo-inositol-1-phosphate synthase